MGDTQIVPPILARPGQSEIIKHDASTELGLPIRQAFWLSVTGIFGLIVLCVDAIVIGPAVGVLIVALAIALIAYIAVAWVWTADDSTVELAMGKRMAVLGASIVFVAAEVAWLANSERVVNAVWPPIHVPLPAWGIALVLLASLPILATCVLLAFRLSYEIIDPNWPPTIASREARHGPSWPWQHIEDGEDGEDSEPPVTREDILLMIEQLANQKTRVVRETPRIIQGRATNPKNSQVYSETGDAQMDAALHDMQPGNGQEQVEYPATFHGERAGECSIAMRCNGSTSAKVSRTLAREFIQMMYMQDRISVRELRAAGLGDGAQDTIRRAMVYCGIAAPADGRKRARMTLLISQEEALEMFDRVFADIPL